MGLVVRAEKNQRRLECVAIAISLVYWSKQLDIKQQNSLKCII